MGRLTHRPRMESMNQEIERDLSIFMTCRQLNPEAVSPLPPGYTIRPIRQNEFSEWMDLPFDTAKEARQYRSFMKAFFNRVYAPRVDLFFERSVVACTADDQPIGTTFPWTIQGDITTLHWLKVKKAYEGSGIGRALISTVLKALPESAYPVYLHTHPSCYRAVKLYSDFGFELLVDHEIGTRTNDLKQALPLLKQWMPADAYAKLKTTEAPPLFIQRMKKEKEPEF